MTDEHIVSGIMHDHRVTYGRRTEAIQPANEDPPSAKYFDRAGNPVTLRMCTVSEVETLYGPDFPLNLREPRNEILLGYLPLP